MPPDLLTLAFDTSAAHCAAALLCGDRELASAHEEMRKGQTERLFPLLEEMLERGGANWADLDLLGVGIGPGNFTGIRISVSAARGLALSLGIKAVGISPLEAQAEGHAHPLLSLGAAHAGQVYAARVDRNAMATPALMAPEEALELAKAQDLPVCAAPPLVEGVTTAPGLHLLPSGPLAPAIARLAQRRADDAPERPAPLYVRPADAAPSRDTAPVILP
ncbi:tRNA (adenosine(37)-N6)-threonylcarbamoyltransferase complex dimerization subunit type 1 TsaB [Brevirhabdus pacifica]|uniref:tRNA (Adenosine(37)-N6)-threonylcarbamoyltransferase complex dimerization subunit type 1 TsaB n=2 Tax=Brevirhabdus pacifica TaxID=1267768 RepID=A0A1U7DK09_9RHOB|nr:tRNA (adenosine(37)-N6)-threonylcarbamoyltransferase complex dimerization subunit type 1 TsaB [Brevirhabdus pacifica]APX90233.1 tRNA (adenosine(37)-N6)-threonylcarbamoyltransferase complex dimerization subunit type 1 TsaB [Brevirhabdus pacifica]OWU78717.1 hypothetical protein ATO5_08195 [Loktanella sp. 22II-4b]PJJ80670.1 tRNA threonylcarbamoyl adenosine modification protein YeaZ [Brevirhabdus pacifica]